MNKARRKDIDEIYSAIDEAHKAMSAHTENLDGLADEEREAFDNLSEGLQQSDQGQMTEAAADALDNAKTYMEQIMSDIDDLLNFLDEARQ